MLWALLLAFALADPAAVTGVVKDSTGGVISGATIILRSNSGAEQRTVSAPDGTFEFPKRPEGPATLIARAGGFAEKTQIVSALEHIEVVLFLPKLGEAVSVTPTRVEQALGDTPASVNVIDGDEIRQSPAVIADDVLRQVPTFSLFRRTTAISANPTAQGVSLRGIGPSGVSRTLVLIDNVPFNDPFGGWVYWTRVPLEDVDRIEMVNGSGSSLYGNYAMGGVINVVSRRPTKRTLELSPQFGSRSTPKLDVYGSDVWGKVGVAVNASAFDTDGFKQVKANEAGPIDTNAAVKFSNFTSKIDYNPSARVSTFVRGGYFEENRDNAKVATADCPPVGPNCSEESNSTVFRSVNGGTRMVLRDQSDLQVTAFYDSVSYHQNFLAVPNTVTRATARVTLNQFVPTRNTGGMVQWSRAIGVKNFFTAGTDWRWVKGDSNEDAMDAITGTTVVTHRVSGGRQRGLGGFVQDIYKPTVKLTITGSARVDKWRSYDGHNLETTVATGQPTAGNNPNLADKEDTVGSPRIAALYHLTSRVNVWGDIGKGYRAPTLNELYRQFRVGAKLTLANENLSSERLLGGETGLSVSLPHDVLVHTTWYDNRMTDPVSTKNLNPAGTTVQRVNLGKTRIWGWQTDVETHLNDSWRVTAGYLYNSAKVEENPLDPTLVGKYLVQVPKNRGSAQITYANPKYLNASLGMQFIGRQFDDDQNVVVVPGETTPGLPEYAMVDITLSRAFGRNFEVYFGVQNLLDKEYIVQTAPTTIGSPRLVTGGLHIRLSGK
jgi:outer membrane receptor protein involved in Fe transport